MARQTRFIQTETDLQRLMNLLPTQEISRFARTQGPELQERFRTQLIDPARAELESLGRGVRQLRRPPERDQEIREGLTPQELFRAKAGAQGIEQGILRSMSGAQVTPQEREQMIREIQGQRRTQQAIGEIGVSPEEQQQLQQIEQGIQQAQMMMQQALSQPAATMKNLATQVKQGIQQAAQLFQGQFPISQQFGVVNKALYSNITSGARHLGLDIAMPVGTTLNMPVAGNIRVGVDPRGFGANIIITGQDGTTYRFSHLSAISDAVRQAAQAGGILPAGTPFGQSGGRPGAPGAGRTTGPHLDITVKQKGRFVDPLTMNAIKQTLL